jgi:6-phosphogluconolactonase
MHLKTTLDNVLVFDTPEDVALAAAERFVAYAQQAVAHHGGFSVALAGGNTPRRVYELLASDDFSNRIEWSKVNLFFGDERCVPPNHPESNYGMVYTSLIASVDIPPGNVHRIVGESDPEKNAAAYEKELRGFFNKLSWPRFDLVLLGMGEDGHTASLFPRSDAVKEESRWVVATRMEQTKQDRITLTAPVFNHAAHVVFLVTGGAKAKRLSEVVQGAPDPERLPAQLVIPLDGSLEWLVDRAAASLVAWNTDLTNSARDQVTKRQ